MNLQFAPLIDQISVPVLGRVVVTIVGVECLKKCPVMVKVGLSRFQKPIGELASVYHRWYARRLENSYNLALVSRLLTTLCKIWLLWLFFIFTSDFFLTERAQLQINFFRKKYLFDIWIYRSFKLPLAPLRTESATWETRRISLVATRAFYFRFVGESKLSCDYSESRMRLESVLVSRLLWAPLAYMLTAQTNIMVVRRAYIIFSRKVEKNARHMSHCYSVLCFLCRTFLCKTNNF